LEFVKEFDASRLAEFIPYRACSGAGARRSAFGSTKSAFGQTQSATNLYSFLAEKEN